MPIRCVPSLSEDPGRPRDLPRGPPGPIAVPSPHAADRISALPSAFRPALPPRGAAFRRCRPAAVPPSCRRPLATAARSPPPSPAPSGPRGLPACPASPCHPGPARTQRHEPPGPAARPTYRPCDPFCRVLPPSCQRAVSRASRGETVSFFQSHPDQQVA